MQKYAFRRKDREEVEREREAHARTQQSVSG